MRKPNIRRRLKGEIPLSAARLRLLAGGAALLCMLLLALVTSGSSNRRFLMMALPMAYAAEPEPAREPEPAIAISRVDVEAGVGEAMRIEVLSPKAQPSVELGGSEPRILIYHTHYSEAYEQKNSSYKYEPSGEWRTLEEDKNIVAVGELLAKVLRDQYGCNVIHDKTNHEPPKLSTAYTRSEITMKQYKERYPSLTMFIDVHRDAGKDPVVSVIDGKRVARLMFVVGTGEGATGSGFKEMPDFESNYALALSITNNLAAIKEDLPRNIRVKTGRYNQHISSQCLLIEVGDNMNTLEEALNAIPHFAKALMQSVQGDNAKPASAQPAASAKASAAPTATPALRWAP